MKTVGSYLRGDALVQSLEGLSQLPPEFRPGHFGTDESGPSAANRVSDAQRYRKFLAKRASSFFLFAKNCRFDVNPSFLSGYATIFVDGVFDFGDDCCRVLVEGLASNSSFTFGCTDEEYHRKNRYDSQRGSNSIETWVGRDLGKYLPGIYWLTVLGPDCLKHLDVDLLAKAGAQVDFVSDGSVHVEMPGGSESGVLRNGGLEALLETQASVFSLPRIRAELDSAKDVGALFRLLAMWP